MAKWAPNHKLTEPWRFILFADEGKEAFIDAYKKSQLGADQTLPEKAKKKAAYFNQIPLHLVVVIPEHPRQKNMG